MTPDKVEAALGVLGSLLRYAEAQICQHDETRRGGAIWEICDRCGAAWADDRGGKPAFEWPAEILAGRKALSVLTEALAESRRDAARISCYQRAVNKIDDLVEYREFTKADIHKILATLTAELQEPPHDR